MGIETATKELQELRQEENKAVATKFLELQKRCTDLQAENESLQGKLETIEASFEDLEKKLNDEIGSLKYELCKAEDDKDEAVKLAIEDFVSSDKYSSLENEKQHLEAQLKELQQTSTNEYVKQIREKLGSQ